jgi:hypothetical protein
MKFEKVNKLSNKNFLRITGVTRRAFNCMVEIITKAEIIKKSKGGRPNKLSVENRILMTLEYLREYRTYAHIGVSYGISESNTYQTIRFIENTLVKSKDFRLPGKKALLKTENEYEVVLIDAEESPIERPKKNKKNFILEKRNDIQ